MAYLQVAMELSTRYCSAIRAPNNERVINADAVQAWRGVAHCTAQQRSPTRAPFYLHSAIATYAEPQLCLELIHRNQHEQTVTVWDGPGRGGCATHSGGLLLRA